MNPETFRTLLSDPTSWRQKAESLRRSGDALWNVYLNQLTSALRNPDADLHDDEGTLLAFNILWNSQLLYALAAECGLKGILIRSQPKLVQNQLTFENDDQGNVISAKFKCGFPFNTHDLEALARKVGILDGRRLHEEMRELLAYGKDVITWSGRYPTPLANDADFRRRHHLPVNAFGEYFRNWFDPFLDQVFEKLDAH